MYITHLLNKRPVGHIAHLINQFICSKLWLYHNVDLERKKIISFLITEWSLFVKLWVPFTTDALCQVLLKLAHWFWRRRWKCEKFTTTTTTTTTMTDNGQILIRKVHLSLWLRCAKNKDRLIVHFQCWTLTARPLKVMTFNDLCPPKNYQCYVPTKVEEMPTEVKEMLPTGGFSRCKQWGDSNED